MLATLATAFKSQLAFDDTAGKLPFVANDGVLVCVLLLLHLLLFHFLLLLLP